MRRSMGAMACLMIVLTASVLAAEEPAAEEPVAEEPVAEKPAQQEPAALAAPAEVAAEKSAQPSEEGRWSDAFFPLSPGLAIKTGGGMQRSVPCGCVDRGLWTTELVGRLHFGWRAALEADMRFGSMLLGGRFPAEGWAVGGRVALFEPRDRWWDGLHVRAGFRQWRVMGMRADGTPGGYGALNWEMNVLPHVYVEADAVVGRTFQAMEHWYLVGTLGVSTRF